MEGELELTFKKHNLQGGTFDLLLHRDPTATLTPTRSQAEMMLSSGATTHRIDLLEKQGSVERSVGLNDRRSTLVKLMKKGKELTGEVVVAHLETEENFYQEHLTTKRSQKSFGKLSPGVRDLVGFDGKTRIRKIETLP